MFNLLCTEFLLRMTSQQSVQGWLRAQLDLILKSPLLRKEGNGDGKEGETKRTKAKKMAGK